jgi:hypothetical protein
MSGWFAGRSWAEWLRPQAASSETDPDVQVRLWKAAWLQGANAQWSARGFDTNPYAAGLERAAWNAGWKWAGKNPDRRVNRAPRAAHRRRRATDWTLQGSVKHVVGVGAAGVTLYAVSRLLRRWMRARSDATNHATMNHVGADQAGRKRS